MDELVYVYLDLASAPQLCGRLWARARKGQESASFEYDEGWLRAANRFSLEPVSFGRKAVSIWGQHWFGSRSPPKTSDSVSVFVFRNFFPRGSVHSDFILIRVRSILDPFNQLRLQILALFAQFGNALRVEKLFGGKSLEIAGEFSFVRAGRSLHFVLIDQPPFWIERACLAAGRNARHINPSRRASPLFGESFALFRRGLCPSAFRSLCVFFCFPFRRSSLSHASAPFRIPFPCGRASF